MKEIGDLSTIMMKKNKVIFETNRFKHHDIHEL